jgi:hypothetical protein
MDDADAKLRGFYQYQIATIAKRARDQTHPASRKRLNLLLNQYIDILLVMPQQNRASLTAGLDRKGVPPNAAARRGDSCKIGVVGRNGEIGLQASNRAPRADARDINRVPRCNRTSGEHGIDAVIATSVP